MPSGYILSRVFSVATAHRSWRLHPDWFPQNKHLSRLKHKQQATCSKCVRMSSRATLSRNKLTQRHFFVSLVRRWECLIIKGEASLVYWEQFTCRPVSSHVSEALKLFVLQQTGFLRVQVPQSLLYLMQYASGKLYEMAHATDIVFFFSCCVVFLLLLLCCVSDGLLACPLFICVSL